MYLDEDYLKLFKQVQEEQTQNVTVKNYDLDQLKNNNINGFNKSDMIKETPNYDIYNTPSPRVTNFNNPNQNLNEVSRQRYTPQNDNLNEFIIEKRFNDEPFENMNEVRREQKQAKLNEILQHRQQQQINEVIKEAAKETDQLLNEVVDFQDADVVTVEMFERARYNSMMTVANRILPK